MMMDISETGMRLSFRQPVEPDTKLSLHIDAGGPRKLRLDGRVVWSDRTNYCHMVGVEFGEHHPEVQRRLKSRLKFWDSLNSSEARTLDRVTSSRR
jgi:PilZ domain-containing protein